MYNLKQNLATIAGVVGIVALGYMPVQAMEFQTEDIKKLHGIKKLLVTVVHETGDNGLLLSATEIEKIYEDRIEKDIDKANNMGRVDGKPDIREIYTVLKDGTPRLEERIFFFADGSARTAEKWSYEMDEKEGVIYGYGDTGNDGQIEGYLVEHLFLTKEEKHDFNNDGVYDYVRKTIELGHGSGEISFIDQGDGRNIVQVRTITPDSGSLEETFIDGKKQSYQILTLKDGTTTTIIYDDGDSTERVIRTTFEINF